MKPIDYAKVYSALARHAAGIDAFEIIPIPELSHPLAHTLEALKQGLIPEQYRWTEEKTRQVYTYNKFQGWAQSIIVAAKYYFTDEEYPDTGGYIPIDTAAKAAAKTPAAPHSGHAKRPYGRIARFTWRNNYRFLVQSLRNMVSGIERDLDVSIRFKALSNYTSIPEKLLVAYSGLAVFGRNSVLLHENMGSRFVIGELLTDLFVDFTALAPGFPATPAAPDFAKCGDCTKCIDACPTGALLGEGRIDVTRCYQYLSENLVFVPHAYRSAWGNRLYGCSTCVDVCPYNSELAPNGEKHHIGHVGTGEDLINLLLYTEEQWGERFKDNQIIIRDRLAIIKNAMLCLGNYPSEEALDQLLSFLSHSSPTIRQYAAWALGKLGGMKSRKALERRLKEEEQASVRNEIERML